MIVKVEYRCNGRPWINEKCDVGVVKIGRHLKHVETEPIPDGVKVSRPYRVHARIKRYWDPFEKGAPRHSPNGGTVTTGRKLLDDFKERWEETERQIFAPRLGPAEPTPYMIVWEPLTPEQLHEIGMALAQLEAAIGETPEAFRTGQDHAHVVGDACVFAFAMRGFVIVANAERAAVVAAEFERSPEQGGLLS